MMKSPLDFVENASCESFRSKIWQPNSELLPIRCLAGKPGRANPALRISIGLQNHSVWAWEIYFRKTALTATKTLRD